MAALWIGASTTAAAQSADGWIDKGLQDLASQTVPKLFEANQAFTQAVRLEPDNHRALALKTITALLLVPQDAAVRELLFDAGYVEKTAEPGTPALLPQFQMPMDEDGVFSPTAGAKTDHVLAYLNSRRGFIDGLLRDLGKIGDPNFKLALGDATGEGGSTDMDYADVRALRAVLFFAKAFTALGNSYNLNLEYRQIYDLYAQDRLTMKDLVERLPRVLNFADRAQRSKVRQELLRGETEMQAAIVAFRARGPLPEGRAFIFEIESDEEAQNASEGLALFARALTQEVVFPASEWVTTEFVGRRMNLSPLFTSSTPLRRLLPTGFAASGAFQRGTWASASLGGILPDINPLVLDKAGAGVWFTTKDDSHFFLEPAIYRPYNFTTMRSGLPPEWMIGGLAIAGNGDTLVADNDAGAVRRITPTGFSSDVLTAAQIPDAYGWFWFYGLAADTADRIYFSDGMRVFRREANGIVSLLAGTDSPPGWDYTPRDGIGAAAVFAWIGNLAADADGNVYVIDGGTSVRKISTSGQVTTLAGRPNTWGTRLVDAPGEAARFEGIYGSIGIDGSGQIWVADGGRAIRRIAPDGSTLTHLVTPPGRDLHYDGALAEASLYEPGSVAADSAGNVYFSDGTTIRKITTGGEVATIGGRPHAPGSRAGRGGQARFGESWGGRHLAMDQSGKLRLTSAGSLLSAESSPIIASHPVDVQDYRGQRVTFSVTAAATNPSYQWSFNGIPIKGATSQSYSVVASNASAGNYTVDVKDGALTETSNPAALSLRPNADWTWAASSNSDQTREVGQNLTFAVENVSGPPGSPISYQWFKDGRLLKDQTSRTLTLRTVRLADSGAYELVITTRAGKESAGPRRLTVVDRGLLIYNLRGTGFLATAGNNKGRRENAVVIVDRINQRSAFVWHAAEARLKQFRVEYPENTAMHSTGPSPGTTSVLSRVMSAGSGADTEKDVIWFTGADTWRRLTSSNGPPAEMLGPVRMKGSVHTLTLSDGVAIETLDASMTLDVAQTLRARSGSGETFEQAVQRIIEEFVSKDYTAEL